MVCNGNPKNLKSTDCHCKPLTRKDQNPKLEAKKAELNSNLKVLNPLFKPPLTSQKIMIRTLKKKTLILHIIRIDQC